MRSGDFQLLKKTFKVVLKRTLLNTLEEAVRSSTYQKDLFKAHWAYYIVL